ncbi:MAG: 4'-phosphopantetheinyl transferase superfamily protein [Gammaproteobacteria bacterium]|nr:4'-phosphopantetheinyl transferase superfamily protein [Gammaproteobacteria bacterium]MDP2140523.1 4'-phosphopantetheinyl transferase superfamily protein [Gammaproteobacteria bacterium]MDP2347292.1 4'-phosphopantetheinyl transferase superfamily protein [Gammaproteobacteria bacterium]
MAFLARDEIHLLLISEEAVDDELLAHYPALLSSEEMVRHARFRFAEDRRRFLITRAAIRSALSIYFPDVAPAVWQFSSNVHGRPAISAPVLVNVPTFNISHTNGLIVIAIANGGELGVDVESVGRSSSTLEVADRFFSRQEVSALMALSESERRSRFFDLWTLKEAWIKALGMGLAMPLHSFSFDFSESRIAISFACERNDDPTRWQFWQWRLSTEHQVALAFATEPGKKMRVLTRNLVPMRSIELVELVPFRTS